MSEELDDLYREVILDHTKHPRNFREITNPTRSADGHNRLCGDKLKIFVKLNGDKIEDVAFQGAGCSIPRPIEATSPTAIQTIQIPSQRSRTGGRGQRSARSSRQEIPRRRVTSSTTAIVSRGSASLNRVERRRGSTPPSQPWGFAVWS